MKPKTNLSRDFNNPMSPLTVSAEANSSIFKSRISKLNMAKSKLE